jgi:glycosyltransferase involved in cell wall biosynthesis
VATGHVPAAQLAALYRGAAAFCYPSLREGFGLPVLEAMAQGTPVITSAGTSTEEVVGIDGDAGLLVDPLDQDDVTGAVERVLEDASLAEHLATNGRLRARTFSWDATADGLVAAYRRAATDPRSR